MTNQGEYDDTAAPIAGAVVRGHRRGPKWTSVTHGVHRPSGLTESQPSSWADEADLAGWQLLMPGAGCFTGLTALGVHGVDLPPRPPACRVFIALSKNDPRPLRRGVHTSRHVRPVPHVVVRGLRVATVAEALLAAARWVGLIDVVTLIDSALHRELATFDELAELSATRRPGSRRLREALALADARAESVWESLLRLLHVVCGIAVEPQWPVMRDGDVVATADLWLCGTDSIHEYDGDEHEKAPRRITDRRRDRRLDRAGFVRRAYTSADVVRRAATILEDADRAVGREHDPSRIRAWHVLLRDSLFTPAGANAFGERIAVRHRPRGQAEGGGR